MHWPSILGGPGKTGSGHFSPVGGYHAGRDMALVLDVARFKYPPHWVPVSLLWEAMDTVVEASDERRGYMLISRQQHEPALLYTLVGYAGCCICCVICFCRCLSLQ